jgi:hypothetical protein
MKKCNKCLSEKSLEEFYPNSYGKLGVKSICKECEKGLKRIYTKNNSEKIKERNKKYYDKIKTTKKYSYKKWSDVSDNIKLANRIRCRVRNTLKGRIKSKPTLEMVGLNIEEFKNHIISTFTEGMTWELFMEGKIHIDHIIPCCNFNLDNKMEQEKCFHYTNLQPLWAKDNLSKNKY